MLNDIAKRPPADDLVQDLLPDSSSAYMLICGRSGIGKTFLALNILHCVAAGKPWLSHKTKQCKVGYLSFEGSDKKIAERFEKIAPSFPGAGENIYWEHSLPIPLNSKGLHKLEEIIIGCKVVIIDPMRPLVAGDYTSPKDAKIFLELLTQLQNETSTRMILLHHIRKPDRRLKVQPEDLQYEVKGAGEYVEGATTVLLLERAGQLHDAQGRFQPTNTGEKWLYAVKVKDAPTNIEPVRLKFNPDTFLFEPLTPSFKEDGW
ncbi:MAG TPA: AAA family ATPase [Dehalococcoidia bacterium]|nr:AAA family ATPase [Dehalococcoidia bacterium]